MDDTGFGSSAESLLTRLHGCLDELQTLPLDPASDDELMQFWRDVESLTRRFPTVDHRLISQAQTRTLPHRYGCTSAAVLMRDALRVGLAKPARGSRPPTRR